VAAEERLDGKYLLSSSDPDLSAEEIALGYKNLREAERSFRDLKTTLELRPVFHRLEHRIRAHVVVCWLALLLIRLAERKTGHSWRRIATELSRLHLVTPPRRRRQLPADHPAHRRPTRDPHRARRRAPAAHHRARARLTRSVALSAAWTHASNPPAGEKPRSQAVSGADACPSTAELGRMARDESTEP
jgi:hypothetical protein